jgi:predicted amidophosphoribosyltransferase
MTFILIFISIILCFIFPIIGIPLLILCGLAEILHAMRPRYICSYCKEEIKPNARVCKHCGAKFNKK